MKVRVIIFPLNYAKITEIINEMEVIINGE